MIPYKQFLFAPWRRRGGAHPGRPPAAPVPGRCRAASDSISCFLRPARL
jgi:hypothetical protein